MFASKRKDSKKNYNAKGLRYFAKVCVITQEVCVKRKDLRYMAKIVRKIKKNVLRLYASVDYNIL